jgi:hypothetical protein
LCGLLLHGAEVIMKVCRYYYGVAGYLAARELLVGYWGWDPGSSSQDE